MSPLPCATWTSPHGRALPPVGRRTLVMAVLNVTPDSFSDGGLLASAASVVDRARRLLAAGADILDIGGESTRPGAEPVGEDEERARVLPALAALRCEFPSAPISIDTTKAAIARAAVGAGADMVNDTGGFTGGLSAAERGAWIAALRRGDPPPDAPPDRSGMARAVADLRCPAFLMHNRPGCDYEDFWPDLLDDLRLSLAVARAAGVPEHQTWVDPGFGFAKEPRHNLEVLRGLGRLTELGRPILLGTSRKSTLGRVLGSPVGDRLDATAATVVWGIQQGCSMVRIHDVSELGRTIRMADAIRKGLAWKDHHG